MLVDLAFALVKYKETLKPLNKIYNIKLYEFNNLTLCCCIAGTTIVKLLG
jgi:hypothetical protein